VGRLDALENKPFDYCLEELVAMQADYLES